MFHLELALDLSESHDGLLEALPILDIDTKSPVFIAQRHGRPFAAEIPFHTYDLLVAHGQILDVGKRDVGRYLLLHRKPGLGNDGHVGKLRIDLDMADTKELLEASGVGRNRLRKQGVASGA